MLQQSQLVDVGQREFCRLVVAPSLLPLINDFSQQRQELCTHHIENSFSSLMFFCHPVFLAVECFLHGAVDDALVEDAVLQFFEKRSYPLVLSCQVVGGE